MALIAADTTFLIDFGKESGQPGGSVHGFLAEHHGDKFALSVTTLGEFAAGFANLAHETFVAVKARFQLLPTDEVVAARRVVAGGEKRNAPISHQNPQSSGYRKRLPLRGKAARHTTPRTSSISGSWYC